MWASASIIHMGSECSPRKANSSRAGLRKPRVGPQVYICDIPSLTLTPGEYSLRVWLEIDDAEADLINDAVRLRRH